MAPDKETKSTETLADYAPFQKKVVPADNARQGVTGHGVRYVLAASLALSLVALFLVWRHII